MSFQSGMAFVLPEEGGLSDNPADPGGVTYQGITQRTYDAWRTAQGLHGRSVSIMAPEERDAIYYADFWTPAHCGDCPSPLDVVMFDIAVQRGPGHAIQTLQDALGVNIDGAWGPETAGALADSNTGTVTQRVLIAFKLHLIDEGAKPGQRVFLNGWLARWGRLNTLAHQGGMA